MELDEEIVFGLGGLQLEPEAEGEGGEWDEEMADVALPQQSSISLAPALVPTAPPRASSSQIRQSQELRPPLAGGVSLWDTKKGPPPRAEPLPEVTYHPVVLDEWEDRIIWEPPGYDRYYCFLL